VSPRALTRRGRLSWPTPREGKNPAGALREIVLVWKPTTLSHRNTATANSSATKWFARLGPFYRARLLLPLPPQRERISPLCDRAANKSVLLTLPKGIASAALGPFRLKLLSLHELPSVARYLPLTRALSTRYVGVQTGGSRCGDSAAKKSGSVPGTLDNQGKEARS